MKSFKDLSEKLKKDKDDPCWKGYVQVGMKKKNGKEVPNCVPKEGVDEKKDTHKTKDGRTAKKGLWYNINQKKKRGEAPAKKGDPDYPKTLNIESIEEKAVSKAQQRFMGMVRAKQKGEMPDASPEVSKAAASMSKKDVKDFAKTKHKGLPAKKESVEEAKVSVGSRVTLKPNKSVLDRSFIGKAGVVTNMLDGEAMVKFANGRTIAVSPSHLTVNESEDDPFYRKTVHRDPNKMRKIAQMDRDSRKRRYDDDEKHLTLWKGKFDADDAAFKYGTTYGDDFKPTKQEVDQINKFFRSNASDKQKKVVYKRLMSRHTSKDTRKKTMDLIKSGQRDMFEAMNFFEFRETLKEAKGSNYQIYHKTYSAAVQHAINHVFDKMGYEVDSQDFFNKVSSGPRKPSPGKTNSFSIDLFDKRTAKPVRQKLHMQVYGMDNGKYELNMYVA